MHPSKYGLAPKVNRDIAMSCKSKETGAQDLGGTVNQTSVRRTKSRERMTSIRSINCPTQRSSFPYYHHYSLGLPTIHSTRRYYWKSAQPRARVRPMVERPMWPCHSVYRETARVERTISLLDFLTAPATISNRL